MTSQAVEAGFDGLVGPTHNYAGLSYGNVASLTHRALQSDPKAAALQGLKKMKFLADAGYVQGVLAPQERPDVYTLRALGFSGKSDADVIERAFKENREVFAACCSASSMWTANAATISPSADSRDGKLHFTPANLVSKFHRSIEYPTTSAILRAIFKDPKFFSHHEALPQGGGFGDEGAANHTRFCENYGSSGLQLFVYGKGKGQKGEKEPKKFPARQTLEASCAVARLHELDDSNVIFVQQSPAAIDAGAFHNDVVSVGNGNCFFFHEQAFVDSKKVLKELKAKYRKVTGRELHLVEVKSRDISLSDAVKSYLFNSLLISTSDGAMKLIAPHECQENKSVRKYLDRLFKRGNTPIQAAEFFDLKQSMRNGGGPACLRLRVVLNQDEFKNTLPSVLMSDDLYTKLCAWVEKNYRDRLSPNDLRDPHLLEESRKALDELTVILKLGSIYPFQK